MTISYNTKTNLFDVDGKYKQKALIAAYLTMVQKKSVITFIIDEKTVTWEEFKKKL